MLVYILKQRESNAYLLLNHVYCFCNGPVMGSIEDLPRLPWGLDPAASWAARPVASELPDTETPQKQ